MMVFTNFFRDQMDRFGEIDIMVDNIAKSISNKGIKLLLNADDPFVESLENCKSFHCVLRNEKICT